MITRLRNYHFVVDIAAVVPDHLEEVWNELHGSLRTALETIVRDNTDHYGIEADVRVDELGTPPSWAK